MRATIVVAAACVIGAFGCRQLLGIEEVGEAREDAPGDSPPAADAGLCIAISTECASSEILRTCVALGAPPIDTPCAWGCGNAPGGAHCLALIPSGGALGPADLAMTSGLVDVTLAAGTIVDTSTGAIGTVTNLQGLRKAGVGLNDGIDFAIRSGVGVFRMQKLRVTGTVSVVGTNAASVVAIDTITLEGDFDLRGPCSGTTGGPGGFAGGLMNSAASGSGAGGAGGAPSSGGGGGGHGGAGGSGGNMGGVGGPTYDSATLVKLAGGGGGGGGTGGGNAGRGGGGGGAIQLAANVAVDVTILGGVNAGGCGGSPGLGGTDGGGGGGAGGTILIEASRVELFGILTVNGGGGGEGGGPASGENGRADRTSATGGGLDGGNGGAGGALAGLAGKGIPGGGGGGGVGRIRINTRTGTTSGIGVLSPSFNDPGSTCTSGVAALE